MLKSLLRLFLLLSTATALAQPITPTADLPEIKIGTVGKPVVNINAYSNITKTQTAYINKINQEGGINGRQIRQIFSDSVQSLITSDQVFCIFGSVGTPSNHSIIQYLNQNKIPELFVSAGSSAFYQPQKYPWTISVLPSYYAEGRAYAKYVRDHISNPKIGILYTNNEFGKMYVQAFNDVFGTKALQTIIKQISVTSGTPNVASQLATMERSGVNVLVFNPPPEYAVEGLRTINSLNWFPTVFISSSIASREHQLKSAGYAYIQGFLTATPFKDPLSSDSQNDADVIEFRTFMTQFYPEGPLDRVSAIGYISSRLLEYVLKQTSENMTRNNVMAIANNLSIPGDVIGMLYPGINIKTTPKNNQIYSHLEILKFIGDDWQSFRLINLD